MANKRIELSLPPDGLPMASLLITEGAVCVQVPSCLGASADSWKQQTKVVYHWGS